jgi:hypothetical protein
MWQHSSKHSDSTDTRLDTEQISMIIWLTK